MHVQSQSPSIPPEIRGKISIELLFIIDNVICIDVPESFVHHIQLNKMIVIYQSDGLEYVEIHSFKVHIM